MFIGRNIRKYRLEMNKFYTTLPLKITYVQFYVNRKKNFYVNRKKKRDNSYTHMHAQFC